MQEIEVLVRLQDEFERALECVRLQADEDTVEHTHDVYLYDPLRDNLQPDKEGALTEALRIRTQDKGSTLTYKQDHFNGDGAWLHSDEVETEVENSERTKEIFYQLGFQTLVEVDATKYHFKTDAYKVTLESVIGLGQFLEVEAHQVPEARDTERVRSEIKQFIETLGLSISGDVGVGKPELLLRKQRS